MSTMCECTDTHVCDTCTLAEVARWRAEQDAKQKPPPAKPTHVAITAAKGLGFWLLICLLAAFVLPLAVTQMFP